MAEDKIEAQLKDRLYCTDNAFLSEELKSTMCDELIPEVNALANECAALRRLCRDLAVKLKDVPPDIYGAMTIALKVTPQDLKRLRDAAEGRDVK